jgi:hypothetical protein
MSQDRRATAGERGACRRRRPAPLQPMRHGPVAGVQRAQSKALDERRNARLGLRVVAGDEHSQQAALGQDIAEDGVEGPDDLRACGAALATSCAMEVPSGMASPVAPGLKGLVVSTMTLAGQRVAVLADDRRGAGAARMTMSPAGAVPIVPAVAPPSALARSAALARSRPMTWTVLPRASARVARMRAMVPVPMMLMLVMMCAWFPTRLTASEAGEPGCMPASA